MELFFGIILLIGGLIHEAIQKNRADQYAETMSRQRNENKK